METFGWDEEDLLEAEEAASSYSILPGTEKSHGHRASCCETITEAKQEAWFMRTLPSATQDKYIKYTSWLQRFLTKVEEKMDEIFRDEEQVRADVSFTSFFIPSLAFNPNPTLTLTLTLE